MRHYESIHWVFSQNQITEVSTLLALGKGLTTSTHFLGRISGTKFLKWNEAQTQHNGKYLNAFSVI